jgi:hypothetical protein
MKLLLILVISYFSDCCSLKHELKPMTKADLESYGRTALDLQTHNFIDLTVKEVYDGVLQNTAFNRHGFALKLSPPQNVRLYSTVDYVEQIINELRILFPDSEVEFRGGSGINVYWQ